MVSPKAHERKRAADDQRVDDLRQHDEMQIGSARSSISIFGVRSIYWIKI